MKNPLSSVITGIAQARNDYRFIRRGQLIPRPVGAEKRALQDQEEANQRVICAEYKRWKKADRRYFCYLKSVANNPCLSDEQKDRMLPCP